MLIQFINSSILIVIATSLLFAIYRMWELNWPDEYFKVEDKESIFISQTFHSLLPNIIDVVNNFWTSLFTVLAIFIYRKMDRRLNIEIKIDNVIKNSNLGLSHELLQLIEEKSKDQNANEILVKAICIAENIERPAWFRKFEYFSSLIAKHGSYGIMQTQTDKSIDDKASINIAIEKYFKNTKYASKEEIEIAIRKYNNSDHYFRFIQEIITFILPQELHGYNYLRES